jgi:ankyrin repeat protein
VSTSCSYEDSDRDTDDQPRINGEGNAEFNAKGDSDFIEDKPSDESDSRMIHPKLTKTANLNTQNADKQTVLHLASQRNNFKGLKIPLEHGANTSVQDSQNQTPSMQAANNGELETVEKLPQYLTNPHII